MPSAARIDDPIGHSISNRFKGLIAGALIGIALVGIAAALGPAAWALMIGGGLKTVMAISFVVGMASLGAAKGKALEDTKTMTGVIETGSSNVFINNKNAARVKLDIPFCQTHPMPPRLAIGTGSDSVYINNMPAARVGDKREVCWAEILEGSPDVFIGGGTTVAPDNKTTKDSGFKSILHLMAITGSFASYCKFWAIETTSDGFSKSYTKFISKLPEKTMEKGKEGVNDLSDGVDESKVWVDALPIDKKTTN